ncbi:hypothetical protein WG219_12815 [Ectopseudomonas mendocina]|uniref:Anti-sigma factor n=1 Tax=Ectopseudomonas mendocina TaxID=300 RepID=A0ABZ2RC82_ECTME
MKHESPMTPEQEQQMLEHFRLHAQGEPSAAVDAQIMAAARAATEQPVTAGQPQYSFSRLYSWLSGGRGQQRWSLALAGVACLGIALSLTWRQFEPTADKYDGVPASESYSAVSSEAPMRPMTAQLIAPSAEMRARSAQPEAALGAQPSAKQRVEAASREQFATLASAPAMETINSDEQPLVIDPDVQERLKALHVLRQEGKEKEAEAALQTLHRDYPDLDIEALLRQWQEQE